MNNCDRSVWLTVIVPVPSLGSHSKVRFEPLVLMRGPILFALESGSGGGIAISGGLVFILAVKGNRWSRSTSMRSSMKKASFTSATGSPTTLFRYFA